MATGYVIVSSAANLCVNELVCQLIVHRKKIIGTKKPLQVT